MKVNIMNDTSNYERGKQLKEDNNKIRKKGEGRKQVRFVNVRCTQEDYQLFQILASQVDRSVSNTIKVAMKEMYSRIVGEKKMLEQEIGVID